MIIRVNTRSGDRGVDLLEPDRFDRFHVEAAAATSREQIDEALRIAGAGTFGVTATDPIISADWIRRTASRDSAWATDFEAMLAYAREKGWYSSADRGVRAHVEYIAADADQPQRTDAGLSADEFRALFRGHPAGVAVVTADVGSGPVGLTVTSVFSVSVDPPVLVFSVSDVSSSAATVTSSRTVVVHLLSSDDLWIAKLCATSGVDRFADTSVWNRLASGEPYFPSASRWVRAEIVSTSRAGTSTIMTVRALSSGSSAGDASRSENPLVYHNRTWHTLTEHSELEVRTG